MSDPYGNPAYDDDLHDLMAIAVLCGHRGVRHDLRPIYAAWEGVYPNDALGGIGRGLALIEEGKPREGYVLIEDTSKTATTRADQAKDVLESLKRDIRDMVEG